jgi:glyoxylase-like metal-dependent hydrolase (beta-lactamase superfamily II)
MENFMSGRIKRIAERISEIAPGILRIVIPLPIPDVGSMNSYVVVDGDRPLMVDPGMAHPAGIEAMEKAIGDLGLDMERTDFFITHHHLDHFGAVSRLLRGSSCIYMSKPEADFIERVAPGEVV